MRAKTLCWTASLALILTALGNTAYAAPRQRAASMVSLETEAGLPTAVTAGRSFSEADLFRLEVQLEHGRDLRLALHAQ